MTLCWLNTRCWLWYEVLRCHDLSKGCFSKDTRCTDEIVDCLERYLLVRSGIVDGLERCSRYGVGWKVSHLWKVMLESAKDRFYRVDTPRQQVPPRIWYGTTCLLIRGTVGSMRCTYS
jgi:hypothetical protein